MIVGLGVDLFDVTRLEHELSRGGTAAELQVFSPGELEYCAARRHPARALASCFAAKEALLKALALDGRDGWPWREVEVAAGGSASPALVLHGRLAATARARGAERILLSLATTRRHAVAAVVLETQT